MFAPVHLYFLVFFALARSAWTFFVFGRYVYYITKNK